MSKLLTDLLDLLGLEKIEENIYRGRSQDLGFGRVFGGQVLGQALSAASQTVDETLSAHSLHAHFLRMGDSSKPIVYSVNCVRDGRSFCTRHVEAVQFGKPILHMTASFHIFEDGFEHQMTMPEVEGPEGLRSEYERTKAAEDKIPESIRAKVVAEKPIEIRPVNPINPFDPKILEPNKYNWFRASGSMPDDMSVHKYMLAYATDFGLLGTSLYPHGHTFWEREMQVASLDHALWFHRDFRMDEWLLHSMDSPSASHALGFTRGSIYDQSGRLVASTAQEGLIRKIELPEE